MKEGLIAIFALMFLMSFAFVSANCNDNQLIMRLTGTTNAHASTWNGSDYSTEICYNETFGAMFGKDPDYTIANPHVCTKLNKMLFLYKINNSHASSKWDENVFNKPVCYGNLQCFFDDSSGNNCDTGVLTARMYRKENSHMEVASGENYPIKVCCTDTYMTDTNFKIINEAHVGNTVYFVSPPGFTNITIKRDGILFFKTKVTEMNSYYDKDLMANIVPWVVPKDIVKGTETDLTIIITNKNGDEAANSGFKVKVNNAQKDDPIVVGMSGVKCGDNFTVGQDIPIVVSASDSDDILSGKIYINGKPLADSNFTNGGTTFMYSTNTAGNIKIEANATNKKDLSSSYIANIMVVDYTKAGNYTAACISSPANFQDFKETLVEFDASTSRGIIVKDDHIPHELIPGRDPFIFNWTFTGGKAMLGGALTQTYNTKGEDYTNPDYYKFQLVYPQTGTKTANLKVELPEEAWKNI